MQSVLETVILINSSYDAVSKSLYAHHLRRWLAHFPLTQIHVVNGDRLIRKPWHELRRVEAFLRLPHEINRAQFFFNATKGFHCVRHKGKSEHCLAKSKGRPHPAVDPAVTAKLRKFYAKHNYEFYDLVGQDFGWPEG